MIDALVFVFDNPDDGWLFMLLLLLLLAIVVDVLIFLANCLFTLLPLF